MKRIRLNDEEVEFLKAFVKKGQKSARELTRARILLLVNEGRTETEIKDVLGICRATVSNVKKRYREKGLDSALKEKPRPGQPRKYTDKEEAEIIATACTSPPNGRKRWSVRLLVDEIKKKKGFETINRESVRLILKKAGLSLG